MERFILIVLIFAFGFLGCSTAPKPAEPSVDFIFHDIAVPFAQVWEESLKLSDQEKVQAFKDSVLPLFPAFYNARFEKWAKHGLDPDKQLLAQMNSFAGIKDEFVKKNDELAERFVGARESFRREFPDFRSSEVYVIHSLGEMDGGTRQFGNKSYFILGVDGMVRFHKGFTSEVPFFHHELFHIYHGQFLTEDMIFWIALWGEGLATYTAEKLNPQAPLIDLMLSQTMIDRIEAKKAFYWKDILSKLESRSEADYQDYFSSSSSSKKIQPRAGYYLGYLIAKEAGRYKTISEMAKLPPVEALELIKKTIISISRH